MVDQRFAFITSADGTHHQVLRTASVFDESGVEYVEPVDWDEAATHAAMAEYEANKPKGMVNAIKNFFS